MRCWAAGVFQHRCRPLRTAATTAMASSSSRATIDPRAWLSAPSALVDVGVNLADAAFDSDRRDVLQV